LNHQLEMHNKWYRVKLAGFAGVCVFYASAVSAAPTLQSTDDTQWRYQSPPQGWANLNGSCDTSSASIYGLEASAFFDPTQAGYQDAMGPIPISGHTHFASCGSWLEGEGAKTEITGLEAGETYTITFYVAGSRPISAHSQRTYQMGRAYRIRIGDDNSGYVTFNSGAWIKQTFNFTAGATSETLMVDTEAYPVRRVLHFAVDSNSIVVTDTDQDGYRCRRIERR